MLRAGGLNQRVALQQPVSAPNDTGEPVVTWTTFATVWAKVEPLSGREQFTAQQDASLVQYRVTIRYRTGITPAMRVVVGTRVLDVQAVMHPDRNVSTVLLYLERKAGE